MKKLEQAIILNVKSLSALSPGGIELEWLTHLVNSTVATTPEQVQAAAAALVNKGELQQPFKGVYFPKGKEVLIARN